MLRACDGAHRTLAPASPPSCPKSCWQRAMADTAVGRAAEFAIARMGSLRMSAMHAISAFSCEISRTDTASQGHAGRFVAAVFFVLENTRSENHIVEFLFRAWPMPVAYMLESTYACKNLYQFSHFRMLRRAFRARKTHQPVLAKVADAADFGIMQPDLVLALSGCGEASEKEAGSWLSATVD